MASNVQGSVFLKSVDSEGRTKTGEWIWVELKKVIQEVGEENVVQVITDNASNCVQMGELMTTEYPHILHSRCVCHVLDLLFEDIGSLSWVKPLVKGCNEVVTFITKKPRVLALFRKLSNRDLIKPWRRLDVTKTAKAQRIRTRILEETPNSFWTRCQHLLVLLGPLLKVLKLADWEGATLGLIFEAMDRMNEKLSEAVETGILVEEEVEEINRFMMEDHGEGGRKAACWFQMHSILHGAAFDLNPAFLHLPLDQEAQEDFVEYLELYCKGDRGLQHKLLHEFQSFHQQLGRLFSSEATKQTKRRSRLLFKNLEKLVFVHTNMCVIQKIKSRSLRLIEHDLDNLELEPQWQRILALQEVVEEPLQQPDDDGASGDDVLDSEDED
ncbi:uncharacterized protein LOC112348352 [Selaginella moellendorffii]|uniref:uncharacterized protein LOC112348352 n=1 Tax=Selaginella moellendorffii TaxID=88036 RepID=UPI000D1C5059|nr:uncharacterized protein LOC112348352 [Selaginella moellendorffii]|eukprot:XP_024536498.1 uncharacterized protein LOC112348352 [Selaginella moellendorffii]